MIKKSEISRAPGRENYRYFKTLTYKIAMETLMAGGNSGNTSSSNGSSEAVVNMRTITAVITDEESSSEDSLEDSVTGTRNMNEE